MDERKMVVPVTLDVAECILKHIHPLTSSSPEYQEAYVKFKDAVKWGQDMAELMKPKQYEDDNGKDSDPSSW